MDGYFTGLGRSRAIAMSLADLITLPVLLEKLKTGLGQVQTRRCPSYPVQSVLGRLYSRMIAKAYDRYLLNQLKPSDAVPKVPQLT
jgi:hypothetical protein